jgi:hypothetical protein
VARRRADGTLSLFVDEREGASQPVRTIGPRRDPALDHLPDVRDGLTRVERVVLWQLGVLEKEREGRNVPTAQLYGRVVEYVNITPEQLTAVLIRLGARNDR